MILESGYGPMIIGFHFLGSVVNNDVVSSYLPYNIIKQYMNDLETPIVQSGQPLLSAPSKSRKLVDLHHKCTFRFIEHGTAKVYGSFLERKGKNTSKVTETLMFEHLMDAGYKPTHTVPVMDSYQPWRIAALDMVNPVNKIDESKLDRCIDAFWDKINSQLSDEDLLDIHVYDDMTTVNGAAGVAYVDAMKRSTSAGNPWKKCKKYYLEECEPTELAPDPRMPTKEILDRVDHIISKYHSGERYMPCFCGSLKDEAVTFKKAAIGKTRVFTGAPMDWSFVVRKYLLSAVRCIQKNKLIFECAPGTNTQSTEWETFYNYLAENGTDRIISGDYKAFDKRMPPCIILGAYKILYRLCAKAGFTENDLKVVWGIAEDTAFPLIDYNGDLMESFGSNPSGHALTVIINGLANSLYVRYSYLNLNEADELLSFAQNVKLITYGDDNVMSVSERAPWFNHTSMQKVLGDIGITYTMADKEAESVPYIDIKEASFLKRTWRWDKDMNTYLCPLEEDSINKSLMICYHDKKKLEMEPRCVAIIKSAVNEYFFYGRERFEEKRKFLQEIADKSDLKDWYEPIYDQVFPSWESLRDRFNKNSE